MAKTYRIGVLGLTHDHVWSNLEELNATEDGKLIAVADPNEPLLEKVRSKYGCATYREYEHLLDQEQLDAVYIFSDNATGVGLGVRAASKGLHVLIEKPMAANLAGAERLLAAARTNKVRLMVNWPFAWWPQLQQAISRALAGDIGEIWQVKYRAAHVGPEKLGCSSYFCDWLFDRELNGAGALMDYCCYGVALARVLLGTPSRVTGVAGRLCKESITVEDNAILMMTYPHALALAEASWTQVDKLTGYITVIYGTRGTLLVEPRLGGRLIRATTEQPQGVEVQAPAGGPHQANASSHFLWGLNTGNPFLLLCQDRICRDVQEMLEAGLIASRTGREVSLPLRRG